MSSTRRPPVASARASAAATVVLPVPPLPVTTWRRARATCSVHPTTGVLTNSEYVDFSTGRSRRGLTSEQHQGDRGADHDDDAPRDDRRQDQQYEQHEDGENDERDRAGDGDVAAGRVPAFTHPGHGEQHQDDPAHGQQRTRDQPPSLHAHTRYRARVPDHDQVGVRHGAAADPRDQADPRPVGRGRMGAGDRAARADGGAAGGLPEAAEVMTTAWSARLAELGIELPAVPAPAGAYVPAV